MKEPLFYINQTIKNIEAAENMEKTYNLYQYFQGLIHMAFFTGIIDEYEKDIFIRDTWFKIEKKKVSM